MTKRRLVDVLSNINWFLISSIAKNIAFQTQRVGLEKCRLYIIYIYLGQISRAENA
jgi:hypothetical protein